MSHICANDEYRSQVGATNRPENIVIRYVSFVSLSRLFACKVVDVFSFHLQIFHWFIAPPSRRYFQGHSPWENPTPLNFTNVVINIYRVFKLYHFENMCEYLAVILMFTLAVSWGRERSKNFQAISWVSAFIFLTNGVASSTVKPLSQLSFTPEQVVVWLFLDKKQLIWFWFIIKWSKEVMYQKEMSKYANQNDNLHF
jgi:hypothetical protein